MTLELQMDGDMLIELLLLIVILHFQRHGIFVVLAALLVVQILWPQITIQPQQLMTALVYMV